MFRLLGKHRFFELLLLGLRRLGDLRRLILNFRLRLSWLGLLSFQWFAFFRGCLSWLFLLRFRVRGSGLLNHRRASLLEGVLLNGLGLNYRSTR